MAGTFVTIYEPEMREFVESQGFTEIFLDRTQEIVYSKVVAKRTCVRIYTSVAHGKSRDIGEDAIRVSLVYKRPDGEITGIGKTAHVKRIDTWKMNLQKRLDMWTLLQGPTCPQCQSPTKKRKGKYGEFFGCVQYPACQGVVRLP